MRKIPLIYIVDDDDDINSLLKKRLDEIQCKGETFTDPKEFLSKLKTHRPDLCLVDINFQSQELGFKIIQSIRNVLGSELPIMVMSSRSDSAAITQALEIGANDYLLKPPYKSYFFEKIGQFIKTNAIESQPIRLRSVPTDLQDIELYFDLEIINISEYGITVKTHELLPKGSTLFVRDPIFEEITGEEKSIILATLSNRALPDTGMFESFLEFDTSNQELLKQVRNWIFTQKDKTL